MKLKVVLKHDVYTECDLAHLIVLVKEKDDILISVMSNDTGHWLNPRFLFSIEGYLGDNNVFDSIRDEIDKYKSGDFKFTIDLDEEYYGKGMMDNIRSYINTQGPYHYFYIRFSHYRANESRDIKCNLEEIIEEPKQMEYFEDYTPDNLKVDKTKFEKYLYPATEFLPAVKNIKFNNIATIIFWSDNTKTVVRRNPSDVNDDKEKAIAMAICRKALGNTRDYYNIFIELLKNLEVKEEIEIPNNEVFEPCRISIIDDTTNGEFRSCLGIQIRFDDYYYSNMYKLLETLDPEKEIKIYIDEVMINTKVDHMSLGEETNSINIDKIYTNTTIWYNNDYKNRYPKFTNVVVIDGNAVAMIEKGLFKFDATKNSDGVYYYINKFHLNDPNFKIDII